MTKAKNKGGRPTDYEPAYCEMLIQHMAEGLSFESFGGVVKKGRSTLYKWRDAHSEFKEAQAIGDSCSRLFWERKLSEGNETIKTDDGTIVTRTMPSANIIFTLKARFKWKDQHEVKLKGKVEVEDKASAQVKELTGVLMDLMKENR